ncbi:MAG: XRE family transcriptional regulator [Actinomycetota bacterium]|nr:XRE family transcriptional regulator [Actinomycetota bacterium]
MTSSRTAVARTPRGSGQIRIGARLRVARLSQKMTIEAVADATGLTKGFISRLERDAASPSVASLVAVCEAIGLRVGALFDPPETAIVRAGKGRPISFGANGAQESLLTPGTQQQIEVIHSLLDGNGHGGEELYALDCESEFVYVVDGELELVLEEGTVPLGAGDAMTFPGRTRHTWRNRSATEPCEVLWILSPAP